MNNSEALEYFCITDNFGSARYLYVSIDPQIKYTPIALFSIEVIYKKYVFIFNLYFLCSQLIHKISQIL